MPDGSMVEIVQKLTQKSRMKDISFDRYQFLKQVKYGHLEKEKKLHDENAAAYS